VHFIESAVCEPTMLVQAGKAVGFVTFELDGRRVGGKSDLLNELAIAVRFPPYFGCNWDAASDLLRDLSWIPAQGYVLLITNGDQLLGLGRGDLTSFVQVVETTMRFWRDERGEHNERSAAVPFHLVLCGTDFLRAGIVPILAEPLCEHVS